MTNTLAEEVYAELQQAKVSEDADALRVREAQQALEDDAGARKGEAAAKRKPKASLAKKHRVMMGNILSGPAEVVPPPLTNA